MLFCCKIGFVAIYAVLSQFTLFCREICFFFMIHDYVEKNCTKNCICGK